MKMNKSQAIEAAKNQARKHEAAKFTVAQIEALGSYTGRRDAANRIALESLDGNEIDTAPKYHGEVVDSFVDGLLSAWSYTQKQLENARRSWKSAISGLTHKQAIEKVTTLVKSMNIRGARVDANGVEVYRLSSYGDAKLYWSFDQDYDAKRRNPDDDTQYAGQYTLSLKVSCSGTSYTPAKMAVINKIHMELVDAANEIEAMMAEERVIWTYGIPEPTPAVELEPVAVACGPDDDRLN